jgi:hypothetical protein
MEIISRHFRSSIMGGGGLSLTRRRVCNIRLLLDLTSSISRFQVPRDSWPHFTLSILRLRQLGGPGSFIYFSLEQAGPVKCAGISSSSSSDLTDGQYADLFWCQAIIWDTQPIFISMENISRYLRFFFLWNALLTSGRVRIRTFATGRCQSCLS